MSCKQKKKKKLIVNRQFESNRLSQTFQQEAYEHIICQEIHVISPLNNKSKQQCEDNEFYKETTNGIWTGCNLCQSVQ